MGVFKDKLLSIIEEAELAKPVEMSNDEIRRQKQVCINRGYDEGHKHLTKAVVIYIYKNALPDNDPLKRASDNDVETKMNEYIKTGNTGNENLLQYLYDSDSKSSAFMDRVKEEAKRANKKKYKEYVEIDLDELDIDSLDSSYTADDKETKDVIDAVDSDTVSDVIRSNVTSYINNEQERVSKEEERMAEIEDALNKDESVIDEATAKDAIARMNATDEVTPAVYIPTLLESVINQNVKRMPEGTRDDIMLESVREITFYTMAKTLQLEKMGPKEIEKLVFSKTLV